MTTRLLPVFLTCFDDAYVSVRQEACIACGRLKVTDQRCLEKLVHLSTFDPIWRVKAYAIQGKDTTKLFDILKKKSKSKVVSSITSVSISHSKNYLRL